MRVFLLLVLTLSNAIAQDFNVFCLSVGSADYIQDRSKFDDGYEPFSEVNGARRSARYMFELCQSKANVNGEILRSEPGRYITKTNVLDALDRVIAMAKKSVGNNPLIVFYFCGHGVSEGIAWNQFLVPGNFTGKLKNNSSETFNKPVIDLADELIYVGEITDKIDNSGIPYVCLIDACYEGKAEDFSSLTKVMSEKPVQNLRDIAAILQVLNQYRGENAVVFATAPGTTTKVVDDPTVEGTYVGPLCRRMKLIEAMLPGKQEMSLKEVMTLINDDNFDRPTSSAITHWGPGENAKGIFLKKK